MSLVLVLGMKIKVVMESWESLPAVVLLRVG